MKVLDLFSGLEGWSAPFRARGHDVYRVELNEKFPAEFRDVLEFDPLRDLPWKPDIVLASPPCTAFSVMTIGKNWTHDHQPKTDKARLGMQLMARALLIIGVSDPAFWLLENPRGKMRRMTHLSGFERRTVSYCQYGEKRMKPTDLWGGFPPSLILKDACKPGAPCHEAAPRGSYTGTQGMDSAESAKIPEELALAVCLAAETDLAGGQAWFNAELVKPKQPDLFNA